MTTHSLSSHDLAPGNSSCARRNASLWMSSAWLSGAPSQRVAEPHPFCESPLLRLQANKRPKATGWWDPSGTWYRGNVRPHFKPQESVQPREESLHQSQALQRCSCTHQDFYFETDYFTWKTELIILTPVWCSLKVVW